MEDFEHYNGAAEADPLDIFRFWCDLLHLFDEQAAALQFQERYTG